jgi:hypothetical protein
MFAEERIQRLFVDWSEEARQLVGQLRIHLARLPDDRRGGALVEDLHTASPKCSQLWNERAVSGFALARKMLRHPTPGGSSLTTSSSRPLMTSNGTYSSSRPPTRQPLPSCHTSPADASGRSHRYVRSLAGPRDLPQLLARDHPADVGMLAPAGGLADNPAQVRKLA